MSTETPSTEPQAVESEAGPFAGAVAQIQTAIQQQLDNGVSPGELGAKIFSAILSALEPEGRPIQPKAGFAAPVGSEIKLGEVTNYVPPQAETTTQQPADGGDDSVGVLVTAPPSANVFSDFGNWVSDTSSATVNHINQGLKAVGNTVVKIGNATVNALDKAGNKIRNVAEDAEKGINKAGPELINNLAKTEQAKG